MPDDLAKAIFPDPGEPVDPIKLARRDLQKALPRRFYKAAEAAPAEDGFAILLDGRPARTPARNALRLPTLAAAEAVASEWHAQEELIDPARMPLTRLVNSAIDGVTAQREATIDEIAKYAGSDLVCYRAGDPRALVEAQSAAWDPVLDFARESLSARFVCAEGLMFVEQPASSRDAVRRAVAAVAGPFRLAALHVMTTLTGSALIALAVAHDVLDAEAAWQAAHVDEDYQMRQWGADDEALARRARRWTEMQAAARLWALA